MDERESEEIAVLRARIGELEQRLAAAGSSDLDLRYEFLAMVSHELRTPLSAILGWATILRTGRGDPGENLQRGLEVIERNARSQARIIDDMLDVSRIIRARLQLQPRLVDVVECAREAVDSLRSAATTKRLDLRLEEAPACYLHADPERLRQVLWNLLANAVKFTPPGGAIVLSIEGGEKQCLIRLSDTGQGIEPSVLPHVFEPFWQADSSTRRAQGGLGLGLALVRHLVELHGGTISVSSAGVGQGTTFVLSLPVELPSEARRRIARIMAPGP